MGDSFLSYSAERAGEAVDCHDTTEPRAEQTLRRRDGSRIIGSAAASAGAPRGARAANPAAVANPAGGHPP